MIASVPLAVLVVASITLAWIDLRRGLIPDWLNLGIAFAGLAWIAARDGAAAVWLAGCEGILVGAVVWTLRRLYFSWRKFQGLGLGDVKLLAASTIWIGIAGVPMQLLVASLTALGAAGMLRLAGHDVTRQTSLPFGPFLAAGLLTILAFQELPTGY
jgi:leader peptidase (prepilin peptidase) / N-methyltransferase